MALKCPTCGLIYIPVGSFGPSTRNQPPTSEPAPCWYCSHGIPIGPREDPKKVTKK